MPRKAKPKPGKPRKSAPPVTPPKTPPAARLDPGHPIPPPPHVPPAQPYIPLQGIVCPRCLARACGKLPAGSRQGFVEYTRYTPDGIRRRRRCLACGKRFWTIERVRSHSA